MLLPAVTGSGASLLVIDRSVEALMVVGSVAELLTSTGSVVAEIALAELEIVPDADGAMPTLMVTVVPLPAPIVPRLHVTVPTSSVQVGEPGADEMNATLAGRT